MIRFASLVIGVCVAALVCLGLVMLASTSAWVKGEQQPYYYLVRQAEMVGAGLVLAVAAYHFKHSWIRKHWLWFLAFASFLLFLCYVPATQVEVNGAHRWIHLPGIGQFQPSAVGRVACMVALAGWFARWQAEVRSFLRGFVAPWAILGIPIVLILFEKNFGEAMDISLGVMIVMFCIGVRVIYLVPLAVAGAAAGWHMLSHNENRMERIHAWLHLDDPAEQIGKGMQQWRGLLAFGHGGMNGVGLGQSNEKLGFLPEFHTDFIFPVIGEELGLAATLGVVLCYVLIAVCGFVIAANVRTMFERCLAIGLTLALVIPAMTNIAVVTACLPNDGKPLPFVSYGGSSVVFSLMTAGLLMGLQRGLRVEAANEIGLPRQTKFAVRL